MPTQSHPRATANRRRALALAVHVALASLPLCAAAAPASQQQAQHYDIAPGPLGTVLSRYAQAAGVSISFSSQQVGSLSSQGLKGSYSVGEGFARILQGSGWTVQAGVDGYVLVAAGPAGSVELGATSINSSTGTAQYSHSYAAPVVTIGKLAQAQKDIPQSVSVVTRQRMDDQGTSTFDQVIMQTPGISRQFVNSGQSSYYSRGFEVTKVLLDGVSSSSSFGVLIAQAPDMATVERVEVIRGAPGLLLGAGEPSGVVNLVRKRPQAETELSITAKAGSWDYYRTDVDLTGRLNDSGTVRGRTVVGYEDRDYFYDRAHSEMPLFYGVVDADITDQTTVMAGYRHQNYDVSGVYFFQGLPSAIDGSDLKLSRSTSVGPDWSAYKSTTHDFFTEVNHRFNDDWQTKLATNLQRSEVYEQGASRQGYGVDPAVGTVAIRRSIRNNYDFYRGGVDASVEGKFSLLGLEQKLVTGANYQQEERDYTARWINYSGTLVNLLSDPQMSSLAKPDFGRGSLQTNEVHTKTYGLYSNLILNPVEPLKVILGGRLTWYKVENYTTGSLSSVFRQDSEFTPYLGLVYALTPEWSAYASYTDIFNVQSNYSTSSGSMLEPAVGSNYEVGLKGELFEGRLQASAALFRILQDNRAAIDPAYPLGDCAAASGGYCYINSGKVESKGVELEVNGELLPGWQAFAGYTYNEAKYLKDRDAYGNASAKEGGQLGDVTPRHIFRAFTTYDLNGALSRVTVGGGVSAQSDLKGTNYSGTRSHMPGRAVWDAFAKYRVDQNWTVSANLNNVFDKVYYNDEYGYRYGEPRNVMLTLRGNFKDF